MTAPDLVTMKFWIVVPAYSKNYCENPTLATPEGIDYLTADASTHALSDDYQRWGAFSCEVTPNTGVAASVYWDNMPITNGDYYTFSVYVKGVSGQAMRIVIKDSAGNAKATTTFTATGYWQREEVTHLGAEVSNLYQLWVTRDAVASTSKFYVDGFQYEQKSSATTFFSGYTAGFGTGDKEYAWEGVPRNSASIRYARTRSGGTLLCIDDYAKVLSVYGFGMGQWEQIMTSMANGGDYYQQHIRKSRNVSLLLAYDGNNQGDIQANRNIILEACRPDMLDGQPMKLVYQGFDENGAEATHPVEITCVLQPSHVDISDSPIFQKDTLVFTVPSGHFDGMYEEGAELDLKAEFTADYIVKRDIDGNWVEYSGGYSSLIDGLTGIVWCIAEAPNGYIFAGGEFLNAGGDALADYLAMWDGSSWKAVGDDGAGGPALDDFVYSMAFDASGDLYIGGGFTDAGGVTNANFIAKISDPTSASPTYSKVGTSVLSSDGIAFIKTIVITQTGVVVAGGSIGYIGATTVHNIVYCDVPNSSDWLELGSGLNAPVNCIKEAFNGDLYIGGNFTNADGADGDYICYWDGSAFNPIFDPTSGVAELSAGVTAIDFTPSGDLIIGGSFTNAGGIAEADYIVGWNGSSYYALGGGNFNEAVARIHCSENGDVYVSGKFTAIGNVDLTDRIALLRNGAWQSLDIDLPGTDYIYAILVTSEGSLIIAGNFTGTAVSGILTTSIEVMESSGNANMYPFIQLHGPGVLASIRNYSTGKSILFDGLTLQEGEWIDLNLDPNNLKFRSSWRGNIMHYVQAGSDYGNFYLKPDQNNISIYMPSGTTADSGGFIKWQPKFWNIEGAKYDS